MDRTIDHIFFRASDISLRIGAAPVFSNISLEVGRGQILGILGPSGAGKSLLVKTCLGLQPDVAQSTGMLEYEGIRIKAKNTGHGDSDTWRSIRAKTAAYIAQNAQSALNPVIRCGRQIAESAKAGGKNSPGLSRSILTLLEKLQLEDPGRIIQAYPHELSGGQQQRIVIAIALIRDPQILFADEAFSGLDFITQAEITSLLKDILLERRMSMVIVSHDIRMLAHFCDSIGVLHEGSLSVPMSPDLLLSGNADPFIRQLKETAKLIRETAFLPKKQTNTDPIIETRNIDKSFGKPSREIKANRDITMEITAGGITGLTGLSGSGKSTLAKILSGLISKDSGTLIIRGKRAGELATRGDFTGVQCIFQDPYSSLYPHKKVRYILVEAALIHRNLKKGQQLDKYLEKLIQDVGLKAEFLDRYPGGLSGGERQRVQIARALAADPEVLICDECLSGLDFLVQLKILKLLGDIQQENQLTLVLISHDLELLRSYTERLYILDEGRVVQYGETESIFTSPGHPRVAELVKITGERQLKWEI